VIRGLVRDDGPAVSIESTDGETRSVTLSSMKTMAVLMREGVYQNQYGNWRDQGAYSGVLLTDLLGDEDYEIVEAVAKDGYRVTIERWRVEDSQFPMILAFSLDGVEVPDWEDGFRIAVLPEEGDVSNEEYGVESAGSYWVKQVVRLVLLP
jgi:hypothetical protein